MRTFAALAIAILLLSTIEQKPVTDPPKTITERVVVGTPPGIVEAKQARIDELSAECRRLTDELRAVRMEKDKLLVKQTTPPPKATGVTRLVTVASSAQVPPATVYRTLPVAGGGNCYGSNCGPAYQRRAILPWRR